MAAPEYQPQTPMPEAPVQQIPEQAEIPREVEQATGMQVVPQAPQQIRDDQGQVVAQPVPPPSAQTGPSIIIPAHDPQQLVQLSKGDPSEAQTWFGVFWLYRLKKAIHDGLNAIFSR